MQLRENFTMESNNARHSAVPTDDCENRNKFLVTRTTFFLFISIFICSLIAVGLLVFNFAVCPNLEENICDNHTYYHLSAHPNPPEISASSMSTSTLTLPTTKMPITLTGSRDAMDVRLPRSIKPITYEVKLVPFLIIDNFTFNGDVEIKFLVLEDCNNITLHSFQLKIDEKDVSVSAESNNEVLTITRQYFVEEKQFFIVELKNTLMKGSYYKITIKYVGILNDNLQGFYRSSYMVGNETRWLATTQFQPTDCRRAIPSFDEPALKAKFKIMIARPSHLISISNMPRVQEIQESSKLYVQHFYY